MSTSLKYFTRRAALGATTKNPALSNLNHLRSIPRAWLLRQTKHDPKIKSVRVGDRIKFWNIVPGDHIRLRGDEDSTIHEVLSINRLSNRVFLKGSTNVQGKDGQPPPSKNYHYSRCQLYMGDYEVALKYDPTGPPQLQPVFASRIGTSASRWNYAIKRFVWRRYAVSTIPKLPDWYSGKKVRIPWPPTLKRKYLDPGVYDTPKDEMARVTYQPPIFDPLASSAPPELPAEEDYLSLLYNTHLGASYNESLPFEVYLDRELANPHSRAKKLERYHIYQATTQALLKKIVANELENLNGRTPREAKADAAFNWREQVKEAGEKKKKARWMHSARVEELERKSVKKSKKEDRQRRLLTELVLKDEPNQVVPKTLKSASPLRS
ncbi:hypothetical protein B0H34DRAFT_687721 [Crassisporium funariophilum]|nr:hypothetical protein B0H34DRAFT_687721 [Crassisporium funariophilum]